MLSAIATAGVASAATDNGTVDKSLPTAAAVRLEAAAFSNPLELAKKYAPDTVNEWKQTLDAFKEHGLKTPSFALSETEMKPAGDGDIKQVDGFRSITIRTEAGDKEGKLTPALNVDSKELSHAAAVAVRGADGKEIKLTAEQVKGGQTVFAPVKDLNAAPVQIKEGSRTDLAITVDANASMELFKAEAELARVEKRGDASEIQTALTRLLDAYQDTIERYQQK